MRRKVLTAQDLYQYLVDQNKNLNFSTFQTGYEISISTIGCFEVKEYRNDEGLVYCNLKAFHDLSNANKSFIDQEVFKKRAITMKDRPIMADIIDIEDENGNMIKDFSGHTMYYDEEKEKTVYVEVPVGHVINPENIRVEYDEEYQRDFALADCVIYEEYTDACDILRRRGKVDCSVELCIREMSFDSSTKELRLDDYYVQGITLLGESVLPGMKGSNVTLKDFSMENNSTYFSRQELINEVTNAVIKQLSDNKADFTAENSKEGGKFDLDKLNELLEKYNKTVDDIDFEYEGLSDEDLESAFAKAFDSDDMEDTDNDDVDVDDNNNDNVENEPEENNDDSENDENLEDESNDSGQSVSAQEDDDSTSVKVNNSINYSVTIDGITKEFAVSLADKINAITTLVNDTYSDADNAWYYCDVYEDDGKYCVMHDFWMDRHFKQEYTVKKDVYSLKGDRVQVYAQYLTQDQINQLDKMKSDYSSIESELNSYKAKELHSKREEVLSSEDYNVMTDFAEFNELKNHMDDYSVDELTEKADLIYAKYMKSNFSKLSSNADSKKKSPIVFMSNGNDEHEEKLPYGGLFKNFKAKK